MLQGFIAELLQKRPIFQGIFANLRRMWYKAEVRIQRSEDGNFGTKIRYNKFSGPD
jgi:hypothetical protein